MGTRVQLQNILEEIIGSTNVYFQPPENVKMRYPCITYSRNRVETKFANDIPYTFQMKYQLIIIDADPDSDILGKIEALPMCSFDRHYTKDNLNHDSYNLYY